MNPAEITKVLALVQAELDQRMALVIDNAETLPFTGQRVVRLTDVSRLMLTYFVSGLSRTLRTEGGDRRHRVRAHWRAGFVAVRAA